MSKEQAALCIICNKGASPDNPLVKNPEMIQDLLNAFHERMSLGDSQWKNVAETLTGLTEFEMKSVHYHSACRKPIVNKVNIERLKAKRHRLMYALANYCTAKGVCGDNSKNTDIYGYRSERFCQKSQIGTSEYSKNVIHELSTLENL